MCIFNASEVKVHKPIRVYKIVVHATYARKNETEDHWISPYRKSIIPKDIIEGKHNMIAYEPNTIPSPYCVSKGYIHSYMDIKDAVKEYYTYYKMAFEDASHLVEMYECEIPADTGKYGEGYCWKGIFSYENYHSIAAREIKFIRHIPSEELFNIYTCASVQTTITLKQRSRLSNASK